jgi:uncharacterized protein (TIGR02421 family)
MGVVMSVSEVDLAMDRRLTEIAGMLPMLQLLTPINVPEQKKAFFERRVVEPEFTYRELPDLTALGDDLAQVEPEEATDAVLVHMIRGMHRDLERRIELLAARNTDRFLLAAIDKWGHVDEALLELSQQVLEEVPPGPPADEYVHAHELAGMATVELDHYRQAYPELATLVHVSELIAGVMVENGDLFISTETSISSDRVVQLLHHEIGVHVLTYVNGSVQPIRMLSLGLDGYEETQEALGVLAEYLGGGLRPKRLRAFALRVMAASSVSQSDTFSQTYELLLSHGAGRNRAFNTTMRAHRSGGMTKDAVYLGGITRLLAFIQAGGSLDSLLVGKISLSDGPFITDLLERKVLVDPPLRPRFLDTQMASEQLARIEDGAGVLELVGIAA